jgi:hypothetical protein
MKRAGNLFEMILLRDNLRLAAARAVRGKRSRADARAFVANLEPNLAALAEGLRTGQLPLGQARQFLIRDPKERIITALPCYPPSSPSRHCHSCTHDPEAHHRPDSTPPIDRD